MEHNNYQVFDQVRVVTLVTTLVIVFVHTLYWQKVKGMENPYDKPAVSLLSLDKTNSVFDVIDREARESIEQSYAETQTQVTTLSPYDTLIDKVREGSLKKFESFVEIDSFMQEIEARKLLHYAILFNYTDVAKLLIQNGCPINSADSAGRMPLFYAVVVNNLDLVVQLLRREAEVAISDVHGDTPLHMAVKLRHPKIVFALIAHGGPMRSINNDKKNPCSMSFELEEYAWRRLTRMNDEEAYNQWRSAYEIRMFLETAQRNVGRQHDTQRQNMLAGYSRISQAIASTI
jgi:hypothetical protein